MGNQDQQVSEQGACHKKHLNRLKRIEGQVRGVHSMVEDGRYCIDILTQIRSVKSALGSLEASILEQHLNRCVQSAVESQDSEDVSKKLDEIKLLLGKVLKP